MLSTDTLARGLDGIALIAPDLRDDEIMREWILDSATPWEEMLAVLRDEFPDAKVWSYVPKATYHVQVVWFLKLEDAACNQVCREAARRQKVCEALALGDWERVAELSICR